MAIPAVQAFEKSLGRRLAHSPIVPAVAQFEQLIKAKQAPAAPEQLGRGSGLKDTSFEAVNPHLMHDKGIRVVNHPKLGRRVLGEDHAEYNTHPVISEYKINNPFERISRLGYQMHQELNGMSDVDRKEIMGAYDHPEHPYHLAYHFKIHDQLLHPESEHFKAGLNKKAGGFSVGRSVDAVRQNIWPVGNQHAKWNELPKTIHESLARLTGKDKSTYSRDLASQAGRSAAWIAGGNRLLHTLRGHAKNGITMTDPHEFHEAAAVHPIAKFSARRPAPGFHAGDVAGKHDVMASGDFDRSGQPAWKPHEYWAPDAKSGSGLPKHITSAHDYMLHLHGVPVGDGRDKKNFGGMAVGLEYVTSAAREFVGKHIRIFGDRTKKRPTPAAAPDALNP